MNLIFHFIKFVYLSYLILLSLSIDYLFLFLLFSRTSSILMLRWMSPTFQCLLRLFSWEIILGECPELGNLIVAFFCIYAKNCMNFCICICQEHRIYSVVFHIVFNNFFILWWVLLLEIHGNAKSNTSDCWKI